MIEIPGWITDIVTWTIGGLCMVTLGAVRLIYREVQSIRLSNTLIKEDWEDRLTAIEKTYVSRTDLDNMVNLLQHDLQKSFDRAHQRIDELYKYRSDK